jgi:predicted nucleic acid-binding protein
MDKVKVFVDSDIVLDLLAKREPFYQPAAELFSKAEKGEVEIYLSPLIFSNLFYILRKMTTRPKAGETLKKLRSLIHILPIDDKIIDQALHSEFPDLEDAIQYFTALDNNISILITRNKRDYKLSAISVNTAAEFLDSR